MTQLAAITLVIASLGAPETPEKEFEATRRHVLPSQEEMEFREIPWRAALWDAVVEARDAERPILLWAMNGHPLGCT